MTSAHVACSLPGSFLAPVKSVQAGSSPPTEFLQVVGGSRRSALSGSASTYWGTCRYGKHPSIKVDLGKGAVQGTKKAVQQKNRVQAALHNMHKYSPEVTPDPAASADRRSVLLGLAATGLWLPSQAAFASPVAAPLPNNCSSQPNRLIGDCCSPLNTRDQILFEPRTDLPVRTRYAISKLQTDTAYMSKYTLAYERMKALPSSDPRSFLNQAKVHCSYCSGAAYNGYDIHGSNLFFPWHRWYLYFHERILANLIEDDTFTLPFWDWDSAAGRNFPSAYGSDRQGPLFNAARLPLLDNPSQMQRFQGYLNRNTSKAAIQSAVLTVEDTETFFGKAVDPEVSGPGSLEIGPHAAVHNDVGSQSQRTPPPTPPNNGTDMGVLQTAGRDPIFYAHHANIDRSWDVWLGLKIDDQDTNRLNPTDSDWLDSEFSFYDENADLVIVKVADTVDIEQTLRYRYDPAYVNEWATTDTPVPAPFRSLASGPSSGLTFVSYVPESVLPDLAAAPEPIPLGPVTPGSQPIDIGTKPLVFEVARDPEKGRATRVETVELEGVSSPMNRSICLRVFLNLPEADVRTPVNVAEFLGYYQTVPHVVEGMSENGEQNVRFNIHRNLAVLGAMDADKITLTVVPTDYADDGTIIEPTEGLASLRGVTVEYL